MEQKNYYAIIPANVRYCKNLNPNTKLLYGEITALTNENGFCYATNDYFAELYGVSPRTITDWIKSLQDNNFVYCELLTKRYEDGTVKKIRKIYINMSNNHIEVLPQNHIDENFAYNNTEDNNINNMIIIYIWDNNEFCECLTKNNDICQRRASYKINGKNYCNQHSKPVLGELFEKDKNNNSKKFIKPTFEEVMNYCLERNNNIDPQYFIDFYESKGWLVGKTPMKDWKAAIRTWENNYKKQTDNNKPTSTLIQEQDGVFSF